MSADLETYRIQLEQIDELLATSPPNAGELLQLKGELEELIELTRAVYESNSLADHRRRRDDGSLSAKDTTTGAAATSTTTTIRFSAEPAVRSWKVGSACEAFKSKENGYRLAVVREIFGDGSCRVSFSRREEETIQLDSLRETKRHPEKERKMQKKLKLQEKMRKEDELSAVCQRKWQGFAKKVAKRGRVNKRSIFATPSTGEGKVGVGTCGVGGRPMTLQPRLATLKKNACS